MVTGNLTLSSLTDEDLVNLLELKKRHPELTFDPTTLRRQIKQVPGQAAQPMVPPLYDGAQFAWRDEKGFRLIQEILRILIPQQP